MPANAVVWQWSWVILIGLAVPSIGTAANPWPTYRCDSGRRGCATCKLTPPLTLRWKYDAGQGPRPAWPPPARGSYWQRLPHIEPRVVDDRAFHPVVADGAVYFSSSADDHVRCLDLSTGRLRWKFGTDGPLRYAPFWSENRLFVGGDDGGLYCLDAHSGSLIWKRGLAPMDLRIPGNGRLISAWPIRTGVVVDEGIVYATAGLFPHQGVYAFAVDAESGAPIWKSKLDFSPQGYLMSSSQLLFVPTGRGNPVALNRMDGHVVTRFDGVGGSYAVISADSLIAGRGNDGSLAMSDVETRERLASFGGQQIVVSPQRFFLLGADRLVAIERPRHNAASRAISQLSRDRARLRSQLSSANDAQVKRLRDDMASLNKRLDTAQREQESSYRWQVSVKHEDSLVGCETHLVLGGDGAIAVHDVETGEEVWTTNVEGRAVGLAMADETIVVATDRGMLYGIGGAGSSDDGAADSIPAALPAAGTMDTQAVTSPAAAEFAERALQKLESPRGYCLVVGLTDGSLVAEVARRSELHIVAVDANQETVSAVRRRLLEQRLYGSRAVVHHVGSTTLPFTDYFANLVVSELPPDQFSGLPWTRDEIRRVTRPCGGVTWLGPKSDPTRRGPLQHAGDWSHQYGNPANTANSGDGLVSSQLQLQWFGAPGPSRMVDRHLRGPAPLCADGRLVVPGENCLIGVDAYNGTERWHVDLPNSQRYTMPYDAGYMSLSGGDIYVAVDGECWQIDAGTGRCGQVWTVPEGTEASHWGYVFADRGHLCGSIQFATASRTQPSRQRIDEDYRHDQPLVTSRALFVMNQSTGTTKWQYEQGVIVNPTITVAKGRVFFAESRDRDAMNDRTGRLRLETLLHSNAFLTALDAETGKTIWQVPFPVELAQARSILYLQSGAGMLIALGSHRSDDNDTRYEIAAFREADGQLVWSAGHAEVKPGAFTHGEQVHHPVLLGRTLVAEPVMYDVTNGQRKGLEKESEQWSLVRPGHSCGTMSGCGECLFFRANNPTVLDIGRRLAGKQRMRKLAPSRPGCWINIIPASGLVLIPEASASCVCHYSLQTSMAFRPVE